MSSTMSCCARFRGRMADAAILFAQNNSVQSPCSEFHIPTTCCHRTLATTHLTCWITMVANRIVAMASPLLPAPTRQQRPHTQSPNNAMTSHSLVLVRLPSKTFDFLSPTLTPDDQAREMIRKDSNPNTSHPHERTSERASEQQVRHRR